MNYRDAIRTIQRHYTHWSAEHVSRMLDIALKSESDNPAIEHIEGVFEDGWVDEHTKWLRSEVGRILSEVLDRAFVIPPHAQY